MKRSLVNFAFAALATLLLADVVAAAQEQENRVRRMSRAEAQTYLTNYFAQERPEIWHCGRAPFLSSDHYRRATAIQFNDTGITIICPNDLRPEITFQSAPDAWVQYIGFYACVGVRPSTGVRPCVQAFRTEEPEVFSEAWLALQRQPVLDPTTDAAFQESLQQVRASTADRTEDQRRVQVRAEAFISAGRTADALEVYQTALASSPDWSTGHYNAALVAAELEQYELAITEMRRYLYLEPNAPDVRAAQDQIYRWEAMLE